MDEKMVRKTNRILREILYRVYELGETFMTQKSLAQSCGCSLDAVNRMINRLSSFGGVEKRPQGFVVSNPKKILLYWATTRNLWNDFLYSSYVPEPVEEIERMLPQGSVLTAFSGCRQRFHDLPQHHCVFAYSNESVKEIFPEREIEPNVIIFRSDPHLEKLSTNGCPLAQLYVDLWQLNDPLAERYLAKLEEVLTKKLMEGFRRLLARTYFPTTSSLT